MIMDGNGRWAQKQGLSRTEGHKKGAQNVKELTSYVAKRGDVTHLTLYAFSTENWKRPKLEVSFLMNLLDEWLSHQTHVYVENNVKFETIGDLSLFSKKLIKRIETTKEMTKEATGLQQTLALNYGSKDEIIRAVKKLSSCEELNEEKLSTLLDTTSMPDVDMLIRTGGEKRLSNFLLWQAAYAELFFTDSYWPEFNEKELDTMITHYSQRERRYGGLV